MTETETRVSGGKPGPPGKSFVPRTLAGRLALAAAGVALASWVVLPLITVTYRHTYPITDTWIMPVIGVVLLDVATVLNLLCVWRWGERSRLNVITTVLLVPTALLFTLIVIGEVLGGAQCG